MNLAPIDQSHWSGESVSFDSAPLSLLPRSWEAGNWSGEGGSDACRCLQPRLAPTSRCYREPPRHVPSRAAQRSCKNPSLDFTTTFLHNHSRLLLDTLTLPLLYIWHHLHSQTSFINLFHKPLSQTSFTNLFHKTNTSFSFNFNTIKTMSQSPPYWNPEATPFAPMSSQQPTPLSADAAVFVPPMDLPSDFYNPPAFLEYGMTQPGDLQQFDDGYFSTPSGSPYWSDGEEVVVAQSIEDGWPPVDAEQMLLPCELEGSQGVDALPLVGIADPVVDYYGANAIGENDFNAAMSPPEPYIPKRSVTKKHPGAINAGVKKSAKKVPSKKRMSPRQEEELGMLFLSVSDKHKMANVVIDKQDKMRDYAQRLGQNVRVTRTHGRITIEGVFWTAPQNDPSIPRSHVDQVACVQQLVAAMLDTSVCKEKKTTTAFQNRWGAGATFYSAEEFQHAAWTLVVSPPSLPHLTSPHQPHYRTSPSTCTPTAGPRPSRTNTSATPSRRQCTAHSATASRRCASCSRAQSARARAY